MEEQTAVVDVAASDARNVITINTTAEGYRPGDTIWLPPNFLRFGVATDPAKIAVLELEKPTATELKVSPDSPDAEYMRLASKLGIKSPVILEAKLERVLEEERIHVYNFDKVSAFLQNECQRLRKKSAEAKTFNSYQWYWKPLREQDRNKKLSKALNEIYLQKVPDVVLMTVEKIADRMPEAKFFVSEIKEYEDPFLGVTVKKSSKIWVIERWNEPAFMG